jgi:hypothetical protein
MCICDRSRGAGIKHQKGASLRALGGPQASSCDDVNIVVIKTSPVHLTIILELPYPFILIVILGYALDHRSWIDALVAYGYHPIYPYYPYY